LQDLPQRRFLVLHPAWGYFADTYGLVQIPVERDGKEPGAQALAELVDEARRDGLKVIFVQPQFNPKPAETQAIGGRIEVLDDLAPDYAANLRRAAWLLVEAARP
jgi:zinc transport system substrate-binding protein